MIPTSLAAAYVQAQVSPFMSSLAPVASSRERIPCTVYVSGIDQQLQEEHITQFFTICGPISNIRLCGDNDHHSKFAFIEFTTSEAAITAAAMSGIQLGSGIIRILPSKTAIQGARPLNSHSSAISTLDPSYYERACRTVYVGSVDVGLTEDDLLQLFGGCGTITKLCLAGDTAHAARFAFVEFTSSAAAQKAILLNGTMVGERPIRVNQSKTPIHAIPKNIVALSDLLHDPCKNPVMEEDLEAAQRLLAARRMEDIPSDRKQSKKAKRKRSSSSDDSLTSSTSSSSSRSRSRSRRRARTKRKKSHRSSKRDRRSRSRSRSRGRDRNRRHTHRSFSRSETRSRSRSGERERRERRERSKSRDRERRERSRSRNKERRDRSKSRDQERRDRSKSRDKVKRSSSGPISKGTLYVKKPLTNLNEPEDNNQDMRNNASLVQNQ